MKSAAHGMPSGIRPEVVALGKVLAHLRTERGLSQEELARKASLSQPTLSRFERGAGQPDALSLRRLAESLGMSIDEIHGRVDLALTRAADMSAAATRSRPVSDWWDSAVTALGVAAVVMLVGVAVAAVFRGVKSGGGGGR